MDDMTSLKIACDRTIINRKTRPSQVTVRESSPAFLHALQDGKKAGEALDVIKGLFK